MQCHSLLSCSLSLAVATVPTLRIGSRSGSNLKPDHCNWFYRTKSWTLAIGPVLPPKTRQFNITSLLAIKYLSSNRIVTWSVCRLCSLRRCVTSRFQMYDTTTIYWVPIENPVILSVIWCYFTAIQWILVSSQISARGVKAQITLHNLHTDHVMIQSELR